MTEQFVFESLESCIEKYASVAPDKLAVICGTKQVTYKVLWDSIIARRDILCREGLMPHRPYVFKASQDIDFLVTYCAVHCNGSIAVPLGKNEADGIFDEVRKEVESCHYEDGITDILYTTGTTGRSKGVMLSRECLASCAENFINDLQFSSDLLFIVSGPLNHIASLFKIHPTLSICGTLCILDGLKDINAFFDVFSLPFPKFGTFLVPASIRMLLQLSFDRLAAISDKIDFIETGAAPITRSDMETLSKILPKSRLYNTYGGTEIGCVCTYNFNDGKYLEGCVGRPMKNSSIRVTDEGQVIVSGRTIMSGYVADEESTAKVLDNGCIYGSDLGYLDGNGMLFLKGRSGDVINVGGYKVDPAEVENAASTFPLIKDCICVPAIHPVIGVVLKLLYVPSNDSAVDKHTLAVFLKNRLDSYKVPVLYESVKSVNRTFNGKLDRKSYK